MRLFPDVKIDIPNEKSSEKNQSPELYTLEHWELEYIASGRFSKLSEDGLSDRYKEICKNYFVFSGKQNQYYPITNVYSKWFWTKQLFDILLEYKIRKKEPDIQVTYPDTYKSAGSSEYSKLFKFGKREYMENFIKYGNIRIKLASAYNNDKNKVIQDIEYKKEYIENSDGQNIILPNGKKIPCIGESKKTFKVSDFYVFCFSNHYNPLFYKEVPEYNSYVVIHNIKSFLSRVERICSKHNFFSKMNFLFSPIKYYDKYCARSEQGKIYCEIQKDIAYAFEEESRIILYSDTIQCNYPDYVDISIGSLADIAELVIVKK